MEKSMRDYRDPDLSDNSVVARCYPTKTDLLTGKRLSYERECFVRDPTAEVLEITHVLYNGYVFDTQKIKLKYLQHTQPELRYQYELPSGLKAAECPPLEIETCLKILCDARKLDEIVSFANDCAKYAAKYAENTAKYAAENAAKYAENTAEDAAENAARSAEYAAEYAVSAAVSAVSARNAAVYAEYAAEYAVSAAVSAMYAKNAAKYAELLRQSRSIREIAPYLNKVI